MRWGDWLVAWPHFMWDVERSVRYSAPVAVDAVAVADDAVTDDGDGDEDDVVDDDDGGADDCNGCFSMSMGELP